MFSKATMLETRDLRPYYDFVSEHGRLIYTAPSVIILSSLLCADDSIFEMVPCSVVCIEPGASSFVRAHREG